jgi:outer membrane receptor protein involved in Fe transport
MKKYFFLIFLLVFSYSSFAQIKATNKITGKVVSAETNSPLEYSTISIFLPDEKKPFTGCTSDKSGNFLLKEIPTGVYTILIENIGYKPFSVKGVSVNESTGTVNLKTISLSVLNTEMSGVTVVSRSKLIDNKIDKLVFNAEKDLTSQSGDATDLLKKIPQVSVDVDGNVQLAGNNGIRFLINGKPSSAFGSNMADVLQSIPASQIKSIEVITNPGAKYDAEGMGGIINIIMKSSTTKGYSGSISATAGTRMENTALNFGIRKKKISFNVFFSGNKKLRATNLINSNRVTFTDTTSNKLIQHSANDYERHGFQSGIGLEYNPNKYNSISANLNFNNFGNSYTSEMNQSLQNNEPSGTTNILSLLNTENKVAVNTIECAILYKVKFKKEEKTLDIKANTSSSDNKTNGTTQQQAIPDNNINFGTKNNNPAIIKLTELAVDYSNSVRKDVRIGLGSKLSIFDINSNSTTQSYSPNINTYEPNEDLSTSIHYKQKVFAGYGEISFPVARLFETKMGGRFERTEINSVYTGEVVKIPSYNTIVPSVYFSKKIKEKITVKLSYTKRLQRPDYEALNPYIFTIDPKNFTTGNPYLKPEMAHRFEFSYNRDLGKTGSLMITSFYRINYDDIQPFVTYYPSYIIGDSAYSNVALTGKVNIGEERNIGLDLFEDLRFSSKMNFRSNVSLFYRNTLDSAINTNSLNYRFNVNASYQFSNTLTGEVFCNINSPRNEAQGRYPSFSTYNIGLRKQIWNKKGSIALTSNSLFGKYLNMNTSVSGNGFNVESQRKIIFRSIGINFVWKFGKMDFKKTNMENESGAMMP